MRNGRSASIAAVVMCAVALTGGISSAEEAGTGREEGARRVYLHAGATGLFFIPSAAVRSGGADVPGADVTINPNFTGTLELGVFPFPAIPFVEDLAISLTIGIPPTATVDGAGSVAAAGTLGKATYGPTVLSVHYHVRSLPIVEPYVGVGLNYTIIFSNADGSVMNLEAESAFGFVLQAGLDVHLADRWGLFADVKQIFVASDVSGSFGGMPTTGRVTLNPFVASLGVTVRF